MANNNSRKTRRKREFIGFYVEPNIKQKLAAIATLSGCTMSDLMTAFAERAEILYVFLQLPERPAEYALNRPTKIQNRKKEDAHEDAGDPLQDHHRPHPPADSI